MEYEIEVKNRKDLYLDDNDQWMRVNEGVVCLEVRVKLSCTEERVSKVEINLEMPVNMSAVNMNTVS